MGTPAITTRGFGAAEVTVLTGWIADMLDDIGDEKLVARIRSEVVELCRRFPVYGD
jgi:glycine hydroxymethyltransferase